MLVNPSLYSLGYVLKNLEVRVIVIDSFDVLEAHDLFFYEVDQGISPVQYIATTSSCPSCL